MKLLFVHGGEKLKEDNKGNYYTDGSYTQQVWDRYSELSNDITVMFRKEEKIYDENEAKEKFQFFNKNKYKFKQLNDFSKSFKNYFSIKLRKEDRYKIENMVKENDFIIARIPSEASYKAVKFCNKYNKPYLLEVVGCPFDTLWNHSIKGKILSIKEYFKMKSIVKKSCYTTYVSEQFLQKRYPTKGNQLACSDVTINECDKKNLVERLEKVKKFDKKQKIVIGTVAAVNVKYKGQQYVLKAISRLNKQGYNMEYMLVGGGDSTYLKKIAEKYDVSDRVKFLGPLKNKQVIDFMKNIDIYIQPSNAESHGRVIIEAFSTACPCIGSSTGGIPELISKEYIFKRKNSKDLENKIEKMLNDNLSEIAKNNFKKSQEFKLDVLNQKRYDFYEKILKEVKNEKNI